MSEQENPVAMFLSVLDVGDSLLSFRASREVDRILAQRDDDEADRAAEIAIGGRLAESKRQSWERRAARRLQKEAA